jgi:hypothetical protein
VANPYDLAVDIRALVAEPKPDDNYEGTRRFYQSAGFVPLRELSLRTWSDDYALILARRLHSD